MNIQDAFDDKNSAMQRPRDSCRQRHLPSSPSRRFGGGMSMIFFKTTGKAIGVSVPESIVTEIGSASIFTEASDSA